MRAVSLRFATYKMTSAIYFVAGVLLIAGCSDTTGSTGSTAAAATALASLQMASSLPSINSDDSNQTTITLTAVDAANAVVPDATIVVSSNTGNLGSGSVKTDTNGKATLVFSSGSLNKSNRIATITAVSGGVTAQFLLPIVGSTVSINPSVATLPDDGTVPVTLVVTTNDAGGTPIPNSPVTLTTGGAGAVTLTPASQTTDSAGKLNVVVTGTTAGAVTLTAAAVGATSTAAITVSPSLATFAIDQQTLTGTIIPNTKLTAMTFADHLDIRVNAPNAASVIFGTTYGTWGNGQNVQTVTVVAGQASATLTTAQAGVADIQVSDAALLSSTDSMKVTMTAAPASAYKITLQPFPGLVQKSTATSTGVSTLKATVTDINNFPVGGAPVAFSILNPTGGGETVSPVVVASATTTSGGVSLGEAVTTFTSGTKSSAAGGVQVRASVVGTSVVTEAIGVNNTPSGNDASVVIGGTAGSVAFGQATVLGEGQNLSTYILAMSVQVADSNGNPLVGQTVNLSGWPIAWSTSSAPCTYDPDTATTGTFFNEDVDENLSLDTTEDGVRTFYKPIAANLTSGSATVTPVSTSAFYYVQSGMNVSGTGIPANTTVVSITPGPLNVPVVASFTLSNAATLTSVSQLTFGAKGGTVDSIVTPANSASGTLPGTVITDITGTAYFNLEYTKSNALWIVDRIRARTTVQGTETVGETTFRLGALEKDVTTCRLPQSPYFF